VRARSNRRSTSRIVGCVLRFERTPCFKIGEHRSPEIAETLRHGDSLGRRHAHLRALTGFMFMLPWSFAHTSWRIRRDISALMPPLRNPVTTS